MKLADQTLYLISSWVKTYFPSHNCCSLGMFSLWDHSLETNNWDWITESSPCGTNNHVHHIQSHFNPLYSPLWCSKSSSPRLHALSCHHVIGWWTSPDDAQHKILAKVACDYRPSLSIFINQGVCYSENNNIVTQMDSFFFLFVIFFIKIQRKYLLSCSAHLIN